MISLEHDADGINSRALSLFTRRVQEVLGLKGEVNIRISGDRELQELNHRFLTKNKPTDVLSFPSDIPGVDGDIAISGQIAAKNAALLQHPISTEVKILLLHGLLHLAGYDHETDDGEMNARESELRSQFGLPVGLIERHTPAARRPATSARSRLAAPSRTRRSRKR